MLDVADSLARFRSSCCSAEEVSCAWAKPNAFALEETPVAAEEPHCAVARVACGQAAEDGFSKVACMLDLKQLK